MSSNTVAYSDRPRPGLAVSGGAWAIALLAGLSGCAAVGPDYQAPEPEVPDQWHAALAEGLEDGTANLHAWWTTLQDPMLEDLIRRAGEGSKRLEIAFHCILQARAIRGVATGDLYPNLDAAASWQRFRASEGTLGIETPPISRTDDISRLGVDMTWELDVVDMQSAWRTVFGPPTD